MRNVRAFAIIVLFLAMVSSTLAAEPNHDFLLHLPGIAGERSIDRAMVQGYLDGGFNGEFKIIDWPGDNPGIGALVAYDLNHKRAQQIADVIAKRRADFPNSKIIFTSHSGGTGLAVWTLEDLPAGVNVDTLVMMASALSPNYDLSKALSHVNGHAFAFSSLSDIIVLSTGTKMFGTIDGVKGDAAGRVGFIEPPGADPEQYKKLVQYPFDPSWVEFHNIGDHIGGMSRSFATHILAPLVLQGKEPATTLPTTIQTPSGLGRTIGPGK